MQHILKRTTTLAKQIISDAIYDLKWFVTDWWDYTTTKQKLLQIACVVSTVLMFMSIHSCNQAFDSLENTLAETEQNLNTLGKEIKALENTMNGIIDYEQEMK